MEQKEQAAVTDAGKPWPEPALKSLGTILPFDRLLDLFPFYAKRRITHAIVELCARVSVLAQGISELDLGYVLPLDEHIPFADGIGLRIQFLSGDDQLRIRIKPLQM